MGPGLRSLVAAAAAILAAPLPAAEFQPLAELQAEAQAFLTERHLAARYPVDVEVTPPDARLKLKRCESALETDFAGRARSQGRTLLRVACPQPHWQVYLQARVRGYADVLVADRALPRGSVITDDDLRIEKRALDRVGGGFYSDPAEVLGFEARQAVRPGTTLTTRHLAPPRLVLRGQTVDLLVRSGAYTVRMKGTALSDAGKGKLLRVRNNSSGRIVEGQAVSAGVVEVAH